VPLRCVIVDDSPRLLSASKALLERQGVAVVGFASSGDEAAGAIARTRPDVALVDLDLGPESGLDVVARLVAETGTPCILISTHDQADFAELIEASPALGFIGKADLSGDRVRALLSGSRGT
jgi:DNA-binding NarL/FixJ family response regulator